MPLPFVTFSCKISSPLLYTICEACEKVHVFTVTVRCGRLAVCIFPFMLMPFFDLCFYCLIPHQKKKNCATFTYHQGAVIEGVETLCN